MKVTPDQQRLQSLIIDTITLLCKTGLNYNSEFSVDGLIGITVDSRQVFLVNIQDTVTKGDMQSHSKPAADAQVSNRKRKFVDHSHRLHNGSPASDFAQHLLKSQRLASNADSPFVFNPLNHESHTHSPFHEAVDLSDTSARQPLPTTQAVVIKPEADVQGSGSEESEVADALSEYSPYMGNIIPEEQSNGSPAPQVSKVTCIKFILLLLYRRVS